jgi:dihydroorotate dehydrogenase electron transfer subunit
MSKTHRDTVFLEDAEVLRHQGYPSEQYLLRLQAPQVATHALPGSFVHLRCDSQLPLRRPLSIMRTSPQAGWIELLYKAVGQGTRLLAQRQEGESVSVLGPIGRPFQVHSDRPRPILLGGGVGIPPMVFLADHLRQAAGYQPLALMGSEVPFPFAARPSSHLVANMPAGTIAAMPLLEDWGIPSRLASLQGYPGCFEGYVTDLAQRHLEGLSEAQRQQVELFACGPHPMLEACARLAAQWQLPCQVSLEEFMACGIGGCAGCTVQVQTPAGPAMKRVCVDGPVFDAREVFEV